MQQIAITVPFVFKAYATKERQRNAREVYFGEYARLQIPIADESEAPVAARYKTTYRATGRNGEASEDAEDAKQVELRVFDGQFYSAVPSAHDVGQASAEVLTDRELLGQNPIANSVASVSDYSAYSTFIEQGLNDASDYRIERSDRNLQLEKITTLAANYLIIDGKLWARCGHPTIHVTPDKSFTSTSCSIAIDLLTDEELYSTERGGYYFRLDDFENAWEFTRQNVDWGHTRLSAYTIEKVRDIEVLIPEALTADPDLADYVAIAHRVLNDDKSEIIDQGRAVTNAWHDLNDLANEFQAKPSDANLENVMASIETLLKLKTGDNQHLQKRFDRFRDRLNNRPLRKFSGDQPNYKM